MASFYQGKKVLITGGLGFLGSNLAHALVREGAEVTLLDCLLEGHGGNPHNIHEIRSQAKWVKADIRDERALIEAVSAKDVLFNIGAQTSHTNSMQTPLLDVDINARGQILLLETCRKLNPGIRIVYCSTRAIYGGQPKRIISEAALPNPMDIYAADKLVGEHYHRIYNSVHGLNAVILRLANGYGPRAQMLAPTFGILNWFIRLALDDREIKIFGDGKQVRDYLYVDDIVDAFLRVGAMKELNGQVMNVASGKGVPLIDIVKSVVKIAGKGKIVHVPWPETNKKIDVGDFIADIKLLKKATGWKPVTSLDDGLRLTIDFYRKNFRQYWTP